MRYIVLISITLLFSACQKESTPETPPETAYVLQHEGLPKPYLPTDNPLTESGIELGRMLFYEKELSQDNSISCASCHDQKNAFSDTNQFSIGVKGLPGKRQAMAIFNMAWNNNEFFWDGRAELLRHQSLMPIEDPLEMNETLEQVVVKLQKRADYQWWFKKAFPNTPEINSLNISLALEQFMHSIVSNQSKYDKYLKNEIQLSASEERGRFLYFTSYNPSDPSKSGANCAMCHGGPNFENDSYMNNGLDKETEMKDSGRKAVTNFSLDLGKFKVPSLRNIALTPPYMHDGRFNTLEEVVAHYNNGIQISSTTSPTLTSIQQNGGLHLSLQDQKDLVAFLNALSDFELLSNPDYASP